MTPCNSCDNGKCGSCVAEKLVTMKFIKDAKVHCGCAESGHNNTLKSNRPKVKSMFSKVRDDDPHVLEQEVVED